LEYLVRLGSQAHRVRLDFLVKTQGHLEHLASLGNLELREHPVRVFLGLLVSREPLVHLVSLEHRVLPAHLEKKEIRVLRVHLVSQVSQVHLDFQVHLVSQENLDFQVIPVHRELPVKVFLEPPVLLGFLVSLVFLVNQVHRAIREHRAPLGLLDSQENLEHQVSLEQVVLQV
jgi:hypothetical protein